MACRRPLADPRSLGRPASSDGKGGWKHEAARDDDNIDSRCTGPGARGCMDRSMASSGCGRILIVANQTVTGRCTVPCTTAGAPSGTGPARITHGFVAGHTVNASIAQMFLSECYGNLEHVSVDVHTGVLHVRSRRSLHFLGLFAGFVPESARQKFPHTDPAQVLT